MNTPGVNPTNRQERRQGTENPTVLKGSEVVKVDIEKLAAHVLLVLPEFMERLLDAVETLADCAELEAEYTRKMGLIDGTFKEEDFQPEEGAGKEEGDGSSDKN